MDSLKDIPLVKRGTVFNENIIRLLVIFVFKSGLEFLGVQLDTNIDTN